MTPSRLKEIAIRATCSQHGLTQWEAMELVAEVERLRAELRRVAIRNAWRPDELNSCQLCHGEWGDWQSETHAPGCLAAPEAT